MYVPKHSRLREFNGEFLKDCIIQCNEWCESENIVIDSMDGFPVEGGYYLLVSYTVMVNLTTKL